MILKEFEGMQWLEFELLEGFPVVHGCFKRLGGYSSGFLASLNFGRSVRDDLECVGKNFEKVVRALSLKEVITAKLCHGINITAINYSNKNNFPISDALMTNHRRLAIAVT
jgi:copper oxidase (laccase) domain-containing protein